VPWYNIFSFRESLQLDTQPFSGSQWKTIPRQYVCPAADAGLATESGSGFYDMRRIYGFNLQADNNSLLTVNDGDIAGWIAQGTDFAAFKEREITQPSDKLLIADSIDNHLTKQHSDTYVDEVDMSGPNQIAYRHPNESVNLLHYDGHVENGQRAEVAVQPPYSADNTLWDITDNFTRNP
jgi:prepilin-type processing-associated H-X9-DG protein